MVVAQVGQGSTHLLQVAFCKITLDIFIKIPYFDSPSPFPHYYLPFFKVYSSKLFFYRLTLAFFLNSALDSARYILSLRQNHEIIFMGFIHRDHRVHRVLIHCRIYIRYFSVSS
jgi:hypothetical protein